MRALTLWRPWPWAILHGGKDIENRPWACPRSLVGVPIALHAGKVWDEETAEEFAAPGEWHLEGFPPRKADHPEGAIVGLATVARVLHESSLIDRADPARSSRWFMGPWGWVLRDVIALPEPVPCRGAQGLWPVPEDVERHVIMQL